MNFSVLVCSASPLTGNPVDEPIGPAMDLAAELAPAFTRRPRQLRIGVVVPLSSLLGLSDAPVELADRSGLIPGEILREQIAELLEPNNADEVLFTRLLTDDGGRLRTLPSSAASRQRLAQAIALRAGTCRFPTCDVPADRCDPDHHER